MFLPWVDIKSYLEIAKVTHSNREILFAFGPIISGQADLSCMDDLSLLPNVTYTL